MPSSRSYRAVPHEERGDGPDIEEGGGTGALAVGGRDGYELRERGEDSARAVLSASGLVRESR